MSSAIMKIREIAYRISQNENESGFYEGTFRKNWKVKVGICDAKYVNEREIDGLYKLNGNDNVQKLFYHTFFNLKCYLALETFDVTLEEYLDKPKTNLMKIDSVSIIRNITSGLKYLHDLQIVHRNVNCRNIGICYYKRYAKICIGNVDDQKNVVLLLTQPSIDESLIKKDVCDLIKVIVSVLGKTMDCNIPEFSAIFENGSELNLCNEKFFKWINEIQTDLNPKSTLKLLLLRQLLTENSGLSLSCTSILKSPIFWSNKKKYNNMKEIAAQWENELVENIKYIDRMGEIFLKNCNWTNKLMKNCLNGKLKNGQRMSSLVKCITSKIRYYQQAENHESLHQEHMLYYLEKFPFLLSFMVIVNDQINAKNRKDNKCGYLHNKFVNNNLPIELIISTKDVTKHKMIKKSNAEVYDGKYKKFPVALKRISKMDFRLNEIKSIIKLKTRLDVGLDCKSCEQEKCENIIGFHGCYDKDDFVWIVLEKAKEDFKDFNFPNQETKLNILLDTVKGLECLHANSISHLDIKPGNILVVERNCKLVGCLADFGESIDAIKKTYTRSKIRGTDGYIAPELEEAFKSHQKTKSKNKKGFSLNYSKCDIYSLGMVIKRDYLEPISNNESSDMNLKACKELVNFMTEREPICRPDAEAVRKNPVFWNTKQKLGFLEYVHEYGDSHTADPVMKESIENMIKFRKNWVNDITSDEKITQEIQKYITKKKKEQKGAEKSIFSLVELILFIRSEAAIKCFQETRKLLKVNDDKFYLEFWYKNFEISFLYYYMHDVLKYNREFYSTDQPKREFAALQRVEPIENVPILFYTPSTSAFKIPEFITPELKEFIIKAFLGLLDGTANTREYFERLIRARPSMRSIEQSHD